MSFKPILLAILLLIFTSNVVADDPRLVLNTGGHTSLIRKVIFTRDGKYLISAGDDKVIRVWEVGTGRLARTIQGEIDDGDVGKIYAMALSPDERILAVGGWLARERTNRNAIRLHNFLTGEVLNPLLKGHADVITVLAFSPDGHYLVSGSTDGTARVWDLEARKETYPPLRGHTNSIYAVAFSPDNKRIVTSSDDHTLRLWDTARGIQIKALDSKHIDKVRSAAFSPDGRYLVSGGWDKKVLLWDAQTGEFIKELHRQESAIGSLSFSPDGSRLLTGSSDSESIVCYVLAFPEGKVVTRFDQHDNVVIATSLWSNSQGQKVAATAGGDQKTIYLWDPENGKIIHRLKGHGQSVWSVSFAGDGQSIAFGNEHDPKDVNHRGPLQHSITLQTGADYQVVLDGAFNEKAAFARARTSVGEYTLKTNIMEAPNLQIVRNGKIERTITRNTTSGDAHDSYTLTGDGRWIVSGGHYGVLTLYETQTGARLRDFVGHTGDVFAVAVAPDNRTLVSGSADQTLRLWDLEAQSAEVQPLLSIFIAQDNEWVAWTPQGYYTSSLNGDKYIGWHVNHGVNQAADFYPASQFKAQFYRPDVVNEYLRTRGNLELALKTADEKRGINTSANKNPVVPNVRDLAPPVPYFIQPDENENLTETTSERYLVKAAAKKSRPETPDVAELSLFINGTPLATVNDRRLEMNVPLKPGENTLALFATNTEKVTSQPAVVKINFKGHAAKTSQKIMFLGIGMARYQITGRDLNYADQDAIKVKELFESQRNKSPFGDVLAEVYTNEQVNKDLVLDKLDWLKKAERGDLVVIFLSGHGGLYEDDYYFYTYQHNKDADYERYDVSWRLLIRGLKAITNANVILFLDTCHAGAVTGKAKGDDAFEKALRDLQQNNPGKMIFVSSRGNELSYELDGKEGRTHGAFTYALIQGLLGKADNLDKDGIVYTNEIGPWLETEVPKLKPQNPQYTKPDDIPGFRHFPVFVINKR